jgi:hypothetical protein
MTALTCRCCPRPRSRRATPQTIQQHSPPPCPLSAATLGFLRAHTCVRGERRKWPGARTQITMVGNDVAIGEAALGTAAIAIILAIGALAAALRSAADALYAIRRARSVATIRGRPGPSGKQGMDGATGQRGWSDPRTRTPGSWTAMLTARFGTLARMTPSISPSAPPARSSLVSR